MFKTCSIDPQKTFKTDVQSTSYMLYNYSQILNFNAFRFRVTVYFEPSAPIDPNLKGQRYPIYILLVPESPKFQFFFLYSLRFSNCMLFWKKCIQWPRNYLKQFEVKGAPYALQLVPVSPIFGRGAESSLPVAHPGYQVLSDILFRLGLADSECSHTVQFLDSAVLGL